MILPWRIYYAGGETYSPKEGSPYEAPALGVQLVAITDDDVGRVLVSGRDYYWWDDQRKFWGGGDANGLWDYLAQPGPKKVLFGRFVTHREYQACVDAAIADPELPLKTARAPTERF